jgi:hypothetical protein
VCDPCRVVMRFVGGGRFPGALPPARLPAPFQDAPEFGHLRAEGQEEQNGTQMVTGFKCRSLTLVERSVESREKLS